MLDFLKFYLKDVSEFNDSVPSKVSVGLSPLNRVSFVFDLSENPALHEGLYNPLRKEKYPVVWFQRSLREQLFDIDRFKEEFRQFCVISILSDSPEAGRSLFLKFDIPTERIEFLYFNLASVNKVLSGKDFTSKEFLESQSSLLSLETTLFRGV